MDWFQIGDEQERVARRVAEVMRDHGLAEEGLPPRFEMPVPTKGGPLSPALYHHLTRAAEARGDVVLEPEPASGPLARLKDALHRLVLFYVNRLGERQARVNDALLRALAELAQEAERSKAELDDLRRELADLRKRLE